MEYSKNNARRQDAINSARRPGPNFPAERTRPQVVGTATRPESWPIGRPSFISRLSGGRKFRSAFGARRHNGGTFAGKWPRGGRTRSESRHLPARANRIPARQLLLLPGVGSPFPFSSRRPGRSAAAFCDGRVMHASLGMEIEGCRIFGFVEKA